jgi:predicted secreted protein
LAGFSADGRHFLYLESSRDTGAGIPKSSLQVVNMATNACVKQGCVETRFGEADASTELKAAGSQLLQQTSDLRQALQLAAPIAGTELDIVARSRAADGSETVQVRIPGRDQPVELRLVQRQVLSAMQGGTAEQDQAAMQLEIRDRGQTRVLGSLTEYRDWVLNYSIREVHLSPDAKRVAVLVTMTKPTFEGTLGTTLIQGFEL